MVCVIYEPKKAYEMGHIYVTEVSFGDSGGVGRVDGILAVF